MTLVVIPGGVHGADFGAASPRAGWPDYFGATVEWLDRYLRAPAVTAPSRPSR